MYREKNTDIDLWVCDIMIVYLCTSVDHTFPVATRLRLNAVCATYLQLLNAGARS